VLEEYRPRGQKAHAPRRAREEPRADLVLERADVAAEGRLRHPQTPGCTSDVAFLGDGDEIADLGEAHELVQRGASRGPRQARDPFAEGRASGSEIETVLDAPPRGPHTSRMAIEILGASEVERLRRACRAAAETLALVGTRLEPGVSTAQIDRWVREDTERRGGRPSQLGYHGFPAAVCTSKNEVVCHGIPRPDEVLDRGAIVNVDVTTMLGGFHGDTSATFVIGEARPEALHVVEAARRARDAGIAAVREGARLGDVGAAIEELARREGCSVVRDYGGHGIGRKMHTEPHVSHVGRGGTGPRLRAGMAFTIEPMVNLGRPEVRVLPDGWTVVTVDGSLSAQFEHTVLVTRDGCEILTAL
jgi:methionyl aminopeptidase